VLYINVLTPGAILITFLIQAKKIPVMEISFFHTISTLATLTATVISPYYFKKNSIEKVGIISIWVDFILIALTLFYLLIPLSNTWLFFLIPIILSRVPLWSFNLSVTQSMQAMIHKNIRGRVSTVEYSLCSIIFILSYVLVIIFNNPTQLAISVIISCSIIAISCVIYSIWYRIKPVAYTDTTIHKKKEEKTEKIEKIEKPVDLEQ